MRRPETKYTKLNGDHIAYQVMGDGDVNLVLSLGFGSNVDAWWDEPSASHFFERLASFSRLVLYDRRGIGVSDRLPLDALPHWSCYADDLETVMDATGCEQANIVGYIDGSTAAILFAVAHPDRVQSLYLTNASARFLSAPDYECGTDPGTAATLRAAQSMWGTEEFAAIIHPTRAQDRRFLSWYARYQRGSATPKEMDAYTAQNFEVDVRDVLSSIRCPTVVAHRAGGFVIPFEQGVYLADHIPGATFVEIAPGAGIIGEMVDEFIDPIETFLTGSSRTSAAARSVSTVLFTDIVRSTNRTTELGDMRWREVLEAHEGTARAWIEQFGGRFVKGTGDGLMATFDAPRRAIQCAFKLREILGELGLEIRAGLHAGEIEQVSGDIGGMAVNIAARVVDAAGPHEVLVTRTVRDLVFGSEIAFDERDIHALKGIPGDWQLFTANGEGQRGARI